MADLSGSVNAISDDVINIVTDVAKKDIPDTVIDSVKLAVDVVHTTSVCCGLFSHTVKISK